MDPNTTYIQNYGFTKTYINENNKKSKNELKWMGNYDGDKANIILDVNDNGDKKYVNIQLDNNDIMNLLGIQPIQIPLKTRLENDFLGSPITLEGALIKDKLHRHSSKKHRHSSKKHRHSSSKKHRHSSSKKHRHSSKKH